MCIIKSDIFTNHKTKDKEMEKMKETTNKRYRDRQTTKIIQGLHATPKKIFSCGCVEYIKKDQDWMPDPDKDVWIRADLHCFWGCRRHPGNWVYGFEPIK